MSRLEATVTDYLDQGFSPDRHLLSCYRLELRRQGALPLTQVRSVADGRRVCVAGLVTARQRPETAKGHVFLALEDETGLLNVILRLRTYQRFRQVVRAAPLLVITGVVQRRDGAVNLIGQQINSLAIPGARRAASKFFR